MLSAYICTLLPTHHYNSAATTFFYQNPETKNQKPKTEKTQFRKQKITRTHQIKMFRDANQQVQNQRRK